MLEHNLLASKSMHYLGDMSKIPFFSKATAILLCALATAGVSWRQLTTETLAVVH